MNGLFFFAPEGAVFYLSWEPPFNVAYLNSIYPDFYTNKMKEMEFWMQTVEGRSDAKQRISKIHFFFL